MCPACMATAAWIAGSAASGGGLIVFLARTFRFKNGANDIATQNKSKENYDGNQHSRYTASESGFAGRVG
jgi:hypothetical protein